jgi:hypothetical protein
MRTDHEKGSHCLHMQVKGPGRVTKSKRKVETKEKMIKLKCAKIAFNMNNPKST